MKPSRESVHTLFIDLDNTLYDWVSYFVPSFNAMVLRASELLDVPSEILSAQLQEVHQRYGNTEHPFALLEATAVRDLGKMTTREALDYLSPAFDAFNDARKKNLYLYPGVEATLSTIRGLGCQVFGHTEASEVNIRNRARQLRLGGLLDAIYAPAFVGPPHPLGDTRKSGHEVVPVRPLPPEMRKPDPAVLQYILDDVGADPDQSLYVGDSLINDIGMARQAGIMAAWASYGKVHDPNLWNKLVRISHWTASEVTNAANPASSPDEFQVLRSFAELLDLYRFC